MSNSIATIYVKNGFVYTGNYCHLKTDYTNFNIHEVSINVLTVCNNFLHYGYLIAEDVLSEITKYDQFALIDFHDRHMEIFKESLPVGSSNSLQNQDFCYKRFPSEVLDCDEKIIVEKKILGYISSIGVSDPTMAIKLLKISCCSTALSILNNLIMCEYKLSAEEIADILLVSTLKGVSLKWEQFKYTENAIQYFLKLFAINPQKISDFNIKKAMDVFRLCISYCHPHLVNSNSVSGMSFKGMPNLFRKKVLESLNKCSDLKIEALNNKQAWFKLFSMLHPGAYKGKYPNVAVVYDLLFKYKDNFQDNELSVELMAGPLMSKQISKLIACNIKDVPHQLQDLYGRYGVDALELFIINRDRSAIDKLMVICQYLAVTVGFDTLVCSPMAFWKDTDISSTPKNIGNEELIYLYEIVKAEIFDVKHVE